MIEPDDLDRPPAGTLPLEAIYDEATLRRLGAAAPVATEAATGAPVPLGRARSSAVALALTAALAGVREALDPDEGHVVEAEVDPGWEAFADRPVQFVPVWGDPRSSLVLVRPWLAGA